MKELKGTETVCAEIRNINKGKKCEQKNHEQLLTAGAERNLMHSGVAPPLPAGVSGAEIREERFSRKLLFPVHQTQSDQSCC